jgi:ADP-ribosylation factor protein 1
MGLQFSRLWTRLFKGNRDVRLLMLGLDAAGKTTLLYKLKLGETISTIPTIGFNVETVEYKRLRLTTWDIGGQMAVRRLWRHYYQNVQGLIFVIDSKDIDRLGSHKDSEDKTDTVRDELARLVAEDDLRGVPILLYANKQDIYGALEPQQIAERLGLNSLLRGRQWFIQGATATSGLGIFEGLDWLASELDR